MPRKTLSSSSEVKAMFGDFSYTNTGNGSIKIDPNWTRDNLISVDVPQLEDVSGAPARITLHRSISVQFQEALKKTEQAGVLSRILSFDGSWVARHMNWSNSRPLSRHSWGIAVDFNARWNGYGVKPPAAGSTGSVKELVDIFDDYGFAWGGYWNTPDGMHFEAAAIFSDLPDIGEAPASEEIATIVENTTGGWVRIPARRIDGSLWSPVRPLATALLGEDTVHAEHLDTQGKVYIKQKTS